MGNVLGSLNLQGHGLACRDPAHIKRWVQAQLAGRRAMPKCVGVKYDGERCTHPPLRGFSKCRLHLRGLERDASDRERETRYLKILEKGDIPLTEMRARRGLASIARRRLNKMWDIDPRIEGETIIFANQEDRQLAVQWLLNHCNVDLSKPLPGTNRMATPCCINRMLWPAWCVVRGRGYATDDFIAGAKRNVERTIKAEIKFWKKGDEAEGDANDGG